MKLITKTKILVLIIIGILFTFSPTITNWLRFNAENNDVIDLDTENLKGSEVSERIYIIGNSGWLDLKNDGHCTGSGTYYDPYVIKNLVIDGEGSGSCIRIENSSVYFIIDNCKLYNAGGYPYAGIYLIDVENSRIIHNYCSNNSMGIHLEECNYNTILGNFFNSNECGIRLNDCCNNTISDNIANNNDYSGMGIEFSNSNTISDNIANNNDYTGMYIQYSNRNTISGNTVNGNSYWGILLDESHYNNLFGNFAFNNKIGICLHTFCHSLLMVGCHDNNISGNSINDNSEYGIRLYSCHNNNIYLNCFTNNRAHACDDGDYNYWDNGVKGNFWSDYTGLDEEGDGIGDSPYNINGSARSKDYYPLMKCPIPVQKSPFETLILITIISGGAVIGIATILLIRTKRKRI